MGSFHSFTSSILSPFVFLALAVQLNTCELGLLSVDSYTECHAETKGSPGHSSFLNPGFQGFGIFTSKGLFTGLSELNWNGHHVERDPGFEAWLS